MKIVKATPTDLNSIVAFNRQFHLDIPGFRWDTKPWIAEQIQKGTFHVLKDGNASYGAICVQTAIYGLPETDAYVETIATKEDLHRRGYGKQLVDYAAELARSEGKSRLVVESFVEYGVGDFYTRCGFDLESTSGKFGDHPYNVFTMKL
ncbi:MAG: GNAT family N-acetyltransferase [Candidatus Melainabacteria bacterium]|nr:GNAT family N-acetyltransferase [Candidatus Melainabacteria bacterium]